mgnify:FL=1|tara:strand:+ start:807 stop:1352 length:546 start_codon:yes stop_codon:yes gene_type:complete
MKVTLNLTRLKGNNLTPNEYIYLLLKDSGDKQALKYREILTPLDLEKLQSKGMIKILPNNTVTLRQKAVDLFRVRGCEKCWDEFNVAYPIREGDRPLHNDKKKCKIKYMSLVEKNPELHQTVLKSLDFEKDDRRMAGVRKEFRPQWKLMSTYINQESWTMYEDYEATHDTPGELGFGEELL